MGNNFNLIIEELYNIIIQPIDWVYKLTAIKKYKKLLMMSQEMSFSDKYCLEARNHKEKGIVYTPLEISNYIVKNVINPEDIVTNPFIKIIDPACGSGNIIVPCFVYLREVYLENMDKINELHNLGLNSFNINRHIIDKNIFGYDLDPVGLKVLIIDLFIKSGYVNESNFCQGDFLIDEIKGNFNIILGNPPYVGHKMVDRSYSKILKEKYKGIFKDKGDISYCFFKRSLDLLENEGLALRKLGFITSRYFMESPSGIELRKLLNQGALEKIVDFYGIRPFKGIGIDPVIVLMNLNKKCDAVEVFKPSKSKARYKNEFINSVLLNQGEEYQHFHIKQGELKENGWILKNEEELNIIKKIEEKCSKRLSDICKSNQGIITGCDKAFVLDQEACERETIEPELLKPWIKSTSIEKCKVKNTGMYLIYSDLINDEKDFPNAVSYISKYRDKLLQRRECKTGARKWYMLQWGRKQELFEEKNIIFPYKSSSNRFAKASGIYFSADVYSLTINESSEMEGDKLLRLLNSSTYEFYFKSFAKKLGEDQYEYYPNNVMKLGIPADSPEQFGCEQEIFDFFGLDDREISIIKDAIK